MWGKLLMIALLISLKSTSAQSTYELVYQIFQASCASSSCHDNDQPRANLDLQGSGSNAMMEVYNNLVNATPNNGTATDADNLLVKPGDVSRSFLFRKINAGLDPTLSLESGEGSPMPLTGGALSNEDIELVRQWILHGAPANGEVIDVATIESYYQNGISSVPNPPAKPDPSEGFQLHLGPFFIEPGQEDEVFIKHDLMLDETIEVNAIETVMGNQSHHFIINKFLEQNANICGIPINSGGADAFPAGYRDVNNSSHFSALYQGGAQEPGILELPYKTAYIWESGTVIDLNSHYINSNQNQVLAAEVYVNIYTQPAGTASQEMLSFMLPKVDINLPPDGQLKTLSANFPLITCFPQGAYLWALTSHTHELGRDFDIYKSNIGGQNVEHLYDASCALTDGEPGCSTEDYDYQHPPQIEFDEYYKLNNSDWLKMEAQYVNNTNETVNFGLTSQDEMMIMFLFAVRDTAGLNNRAPVAVNDSAEVDEGQSVMINVLGNDNDEEELEVVAIATNPIEGNVVINNDGTVTYTSTGNDGIDQFHYVVCDDVNPPKCDTATVTVDVKPTVGLFNESFKYANVYPNPTNGALRLLLPGAQIRNIQIANLQGKMISNLAFTRTNFGALLDLKAAELQKGVYYLLIDSNEDQRSIAKVVFF